MASMKDVAKLAGVSISTVSRVINNLDGVDEKTRILVEEAILKVNYRPNLLASGLRSKRGTLIGLVVPEIAHQSFSEFIQYTEKFVRESGYGLIIGNTSNNPNKEYEFIDQMVRRNVDGIIFIRVSDSIQMIKQLDTKNIPFVVLDRGSDKGSFPCVLMDNVDTGKLAAKHLIELGHKHLACITGPLNLSLCRDRLSGFAQTLESFNFALPQARIFESDFKFESGVHLVKRILAQDPKVTAIWAQNDLSALGVMAGAKDLGLVLPRDLSIIGVDDIECSRMVRPRLTTIRQPFKEMSRLAVELLLQEKIKPQNNKNYHIVPVELVIRESSGVPK